MEHPIKMDYLGVPPWIGVSPNHVDLKKWDFTLVNGIPWWFNRQAMGFLMGFHGILPTICRSFFQRNYRESLLRWAMGLAHWLVTGDMLPPNNPNEIIHLLSSYIINSVAHLGRDEDLTWFNQELKGAINVVLTSGAWIQMSLTQGTTLAWLSPFHAKAPDPWAVNRQTPHDRCQMEKHGCLKCQMSCWYCKGMKKHQRVWCWCWHWDIVWHYSIFWINDDFTKLKTLATPLPFPRPMPREQTWSGHWKLWSYWDS